MSDRCAAVVEQLSRLNPFAGAEGLSDPPRPDESSIPRHLTSVEQVSHIQKLLDTLSYNHLPRTIFNLEKHRPLQSVLLTGREILSEALPIRCLEATFVALLLTQELKDVERIPLSFKSQANGSHFRHIVLVIRARTATSYRFGALGLSRKSTLMFKPMSFGSLYDVVMDYHREYAALGHEVVDIKLGLAVSHDSTSRFYPCWRFVALRLADYLNSPAAALTPGTASDDANSSKRGCSTAPHHQHSHEPFAEHANEEEDCGSHAQRIAASDDARASDEESAMVNESAHNNSALATSGGESSAAETRNEPANALDAFLRHYEKLLSTMSDQHTKGIHSADGASLATRLCYLDLDLADRNVAAENRRRVDLISRGLSPLSQEARRAAANRQLRPPAKTSTRSASRRGGPAAPSRTTGTSSTVSAKRRSGAPRGGAGGRRGAGNGVPRGSPSSKASVEVDRLGSVAKGGGLRSPNTPVHHGAAAGFPHVASPPHASGDSGERDDTPSEASHSEHALSRHESVESEIFSSLGGSIRGDELLD